MVLRLARFSEWSEPLKVLPVFLASVIIFFMEGAGRDTDAGLSFSRLASRG